MLLTEYLSDLEKAQNVLKQNELTILISLNRGRGEFQILITDLTPEYVKIKASYKS
jgi:N-acetylglutamate synthase/N-acetylornithine aminotransferase